MFILNKKVEEIRIIPMSRSDEFDNQTIEEVQQQYFLNDLVYRQDCKYYYRKSGINSIKGSLLLFQYDNRIIASAQLKSIEKYNEIQSGQYGEYRGAIAFYDETIQVFTPIEVDELKSIDPKFKKFSQTKQFIDVNNLKQIIDLLNYKKKQYDMTYQEKVMAAIVDEKNFKDIPKDKSKICKNSINQWPRDPVIAKRALINANFKCTIDCTHEHFKSKVTGENYVESHHLIPMCYQENFDNSLDVEANIIGLCVVCHKKLHHAELNEKKDMLHTLFNQREKRLEKCGLIISFDELVELYK